MPFLEMLVKDVKYLVRRLMNYIRSGFKNKTIYIFPHYPSSGSTIYKVANVLECNLTNKQKVNNDISVYWEYNTHRTEYDHFTNMENHEVVNLFSRDISKVFVDKAFNEIFGYSTFIDPATYAKPFVKKNDINAKHDGEILTAATDNEEGFIYQKLIDNSAENNMVVDIRVPVVKDVLDFVYLKYRDKNIRFTNSTSRTIVKSVNEVFSNEEIGLINNFCKHINLDYGELDVLRDNDDKKIYIVDVNNTPQGPPKNLNRKDSKESIIKIANEFKLHFLQ